MSIVWSLWNLVAGNAGFCYTDRQKGCEEMRWDCHIHMLFDGVNWKEAIARHREKPEESVIRRNLGIYREREFVYLRDGGDRWGVGAAARELAPEYSIEYRTPLAPLCMAGHYGGFIGEKFQSMADYRQLIRQHRRDGADFIKVMISGLMDFDHLGVLTEPGLSAEQIRRMVDIAHQEGFSVMAHANGAEVVKAAAEAGVDSVEHGAYLDREAMEAMKENGTVWVPTLSTIGNLRGTGRFSQEAVEGILETALSNVRLFGAMGGLIAPGTDAGAWAVPHGTLTEYKLLEQALGRERDVILERGVTALRKKF